MQSSSNSSRVKRISNPNYVRNGRKSYVWLLKKYNIEPTLEGPFRLIDKVGNPQQKVLVKKDVNGQAGEVTAEDSQNDSMYLCPVSIGTPAKTFMLDFDTGSSDLWIWSTELPQQLQTSATTAGHTIFDSSASSTFKQSSGSTWHIQYGDSSSASGDVGTDNVTIGGLTIQNQAIELASTLSQQFSSDTSDGLCGFAWGSINTVSPNTVQTPIENMITQQDIPQTSQLFTACLGSWRDAGNPDKGESFYTMGYIDQSVVNGQTISYVDVDNSQGFWGFPATSAVINGNTVQRSGNTAIADTGTTLALVDDSLCQAIYHAIPGGKYDSTNQAYCFPASTTADQLPTVQFAVGNALFTVNKEDLSFADGGRELIYGGIQSRGSMTFDIYGDVFLKSIYAIFDVGKKRFGAVQRTPPQENLAPPPPSNGGGS